MIVAKVNIECKGCKIIFTVSMKNRCRKYCSSSCFYKKGNAFGNRNGNPGSKVATTNRRNQVIVVCSVCSSEISVKASLAPKLRTCGKQLCKRTHKAVMSNLSNNGAFISGFFEKKDGGKEHYQSSYELRRMKLLDSSDYVASWTKKHKITIRYIHKDNTEHVYKPDFLVKWIDGETTLEEVKGYVSDKDKFNRKNVAAVSYCEDNGMVYRIINECDLEFRKKQRVILLEGPDNCGKSHIGRMLAFNTGIPYFRFDKQHEYWDRGMFKKALEHDQPMMESMLRQLHQDVIIDRCYISEKVYSTVFDRDTNEKLIKKLDLKLSKLGAIVLVALRRSYGSHDDDIIIPSNKFQALHDEYIKFIEWTKCKCIVIYVDDFDNDLNKQCPLIENAIEQLMLSDISKKIIMIEKETVTV